MKSNIETYLRLKPLIINGISNQQNNNSNNNSTFSSLYNINIQNEFQNQQNLIENQIMDYSLNQSKNQISIHIPDEMRKGYVNNMKKSYDFQFNGIFEQNSSQEEIFEIIGKKIIKKSIEGYNNSVFCYGQTGSGKTFTMCGSKNWKERGLIPRILIDLFKTTREIKNYNFDIFISYLEIYNENAYDLLDKNHSEVELENWKKIIIYEDNYNNIMMKNLSMIKVENEQQALDLLITGNYIRHISSTQMNMASSRSHAIFTIIIEGRDLNNEIIRVSKINLVDLAGSERMKSNNQNITSTETKYINLSLSFLEQVIIALNEKEKGNRNHIPYRNSLMTTILKDSLGGNCKTILIANVSSDIHYIDETMSTMRFALRCAKVQNEISKNEHMDLNILVNKLYNENQDLRNKIEMFQKNQGGSFIINKNYLEILNKELTDFEKDECKILISDYLNDESENKKINASNANQLFYIIDFLIDYIKNKEKKYKKEMTELLQENKELIKLAKVEDEKYKKINEVIQKNNLSQYFRGLIKENNEIINSNDKISSNPHNMKSNTINTSKKETNKIYSKVKVKQ
jgi:kinesin family protein 6/9